MSTGYTRQSAAEIISSAIIKSSSFNNELNKIRDAFTFSSDGSTGHTHDGSADEGSYIPLIADVDGNNKVVADAASNRISFYNEVSSSPIEQIRVEDGVLYPATDNDVDLGSSSSKFKTTYTKNLLVETGVSGDLPMGANKITGLADPVAATDAVNLQYLTETLVGSAPSFRPITWQASGTYTTGDKVFSGVNSLVYEALTDHSGVSTDPSSDTTNWKIISSRPITWASGRGYRIGDVVFSPSNWGLYEALTTHSGLVTDPSSDATNWSALTSSFEVNAQTFTSSGTWTKPASGTLVIIEGLGAGGGGGSGRRGAAGTNRQGGGGAGGGAFNRVILPFSDPLLTSTVVVTVGAGGAGGAAVTTDDTDGNDGTAGGNTSFGAGIVLNGGSPGRGGVSTTTAGQAGSGGRLDRGIAEGADGGRTDEDDGFDGLGSALSGSGGGGGGGLDTSNVLRSGGAGGGEDSPFTGAGGAAGTSGGAGGDATATKRDGGGGAASRTAGAANRGGNGGLASGGGGGGASVNGNNSGAGGDGGDGWLRVTVL